LGHEGVWLNLLSSLLVHVAICGFVTKLIYMEGDGIRFKFLGNFAFWVFVALIT